MAEDLVEIKMCQIPLNLTENHIIPKLTHKLQVYAALSKQSVDRYYILSNYLN